MQKFFFFERSFLWALIFYIFFTSLHSHLLPCILHSHLLPCIFCLVSFTLYLSPCIFHLVSFTLHLLPCISCLASLALHLLPCIFCLVSFALHLLPCIFCLVSFALHLLPCIFCLVSFALYLLRRFSLHLLLRFQRCIPAFLYCHIDLWNTTLSPLSYAIISTNALTSSSCPSTRSRFASSMIRSAKALGSTSSPT